MSLQPVDRLIARHYGPMEFWREFGEFLREVRLAGRDYLEYDEWRHVFRRAHKAGVFAVQSDEKGNALPVWGTLCGRGLFLLYKAMKAAKDSGVSAQQFTIDWNAHCDRKSSVTQQFAREYEQQRLRRATEQDPSPRKTRRLRAADDEAVFEVRVGH